MIGEKSIINVADRDGPIPALVFNTGVPGLYCNEYGDGKWVLTHYRSGLRLGKFYHESPEIMIAFAHKIGGILDWEANGYEIQEALNANDGEALLEIVSLAKGLKEFDSSTMNKDPRDINE